VQKEWMYAHRTSSGRAHRAPRARRGSSALRSWARHPSGWRRRRRRRTAGSSLLFSVRRRAKKQETHAFDVLENAVLRFSIHSALCAGIDNARKQPSEPLRTAALDAAALDVDTLDMKIKCTCRGDEGGGRERRGRVTAFMGECSSPKVRLTNGSSTTQPRRPTS
jgi:hypothetical protein